MARHRSERDAIADEIEDVESPRASHASYIVTVRLAGSDEDDDYTFETYSSTTIEHLLIRIRDEHYPDVELSEFVMYTEGAPMTTVGTRVSDYTDSVTAELRIDLMRRRQHTVITAASTFFIDLRITIESDDDDEAEVQTTVAGSTTFEELMRALEEDEVLDPDKEYEIHDARGLRITNYSNEVCSCGVPGQELVLYVVLIEAQLVLVNVRFHPLLRIAGVQTYASINATVSEVLDTLALKDRVVPLVDDQLVSSDVRLREYVQRSETERILTDDEVSVVGRLDMKLLPYF